MSSPSYSSAIRRRLALIRSYLIGFATSWPPRTLTLTAPAHGVTWNFLPKIVNRRTTAHGQHWSPARFKETFRPSAETLDIVHPWLTHEVGVPADNIRLSPSGDILQLNVTVAETEPTLPLDVCVPTPAGVRNVVPVSHTYGAR
ncbi:hypothetical protein B0H13DRAFT_2372051 [Mycena leptocephala]|nr:hypothetical protein B0H13DRAFT_2372051 [Mycena leptocephala]